MGSFLSSVPAWRSSQLLRAMVAALLVQTTIGQTSTIHIPSSTLHSSTTITVLPPPTSSAVPSATIIVEPSTSAVITTALTTLSPTSNSILTTAATATATNSGSVSTGRRVPTTATNIVNVDPSTATSTPAATADSSSSGGRSTTTIVAVVIGCVIVLSVVILLAFRYFVRSRHSQRLPLAELASTSGPSPAAEILRVDAARMRPPPTATNPSSLAPATAAASMTAVDPALAAPGHIRGNQPPTNPHYQQYDPNTAYNPNQYDPIQHGHSGGVVYPQQNIYDAGQIQPQLFPPPNTGFIAPPNSGYYATYDPNTPYTAQPHYYVDANGQYYTDSNIQYYADQGHQYYVDPHQPSFVPQGEKVEMHRFSALSEQTSVENLPMGDINGGGHSASMPVEPVPVTVDAVMHADAAHPAPAATSDSHIPTTQVQVNAPPSEYIGGPARLF
ncbi:hypothetical protein BASA50_010807 [Batrachochytrium salamandrivorans]|uniref:OCRE domain-containing protein n=1 Tax=Batrachochytrium salamandrivorans TaxID=1357716 RepID=A0ABQ8EXE6_9FUNG|nr:hypothetical protein BASA62_003101 [Batrachochytrium salamandrivorans]KAH6579563.1 hypothetical protein BASA61_010153 [Batrachochytrium salamandrivorans]KAH6588256.1 hypothetical protein BASA50_010807 [Batrachochytrium salamandrivorans]KAH9250555.1 hypothetical protein BASA81_011662 [Batrachochytrium salamandrivorans]KAJ1343655.1 hypothetical protein BSLG_001803 [Batrachochytrium salamandrivorans]